MYNAVFLDRDGTINEDVGDLCSQDKLIFIHGSIAALRILQEMFLLFIITNQSGIGKSVFSEEEFLKFNEYFKILLKNEGIAIKHIYYCPHTKEENCICHKPKPYFLIKAEKDYDINLKTSYVVGDHPHDIEMAHKVGAGSVYLLTGHGAKHKQELKLLAHPDIVADDLYEAAARIVKKVNRREVSKYG